MSAGTEFVRLELFRTLQTRRAAQDDFGRVDNAAHEDTLKMHGEFL